MASTVGQIIINGRQLVPDMPQTLPATTATVAVVSSPGSPLTPGTYALEVTQITPYGETIAASETTGVIIAANQAFQITSPLQPTATKIRAYYTLPNGAPGTEQQYAESTGSPFSFYQPTGYSVPPQLNRAFLPDSDGGLISAAAVFGWLNDGLRFISRHAGGLLDYSGIGSVSNNPWYTINGEWIAITSIWYDGYWMTGGDRGYFWRRNNITSQVLSAASISVINNQNILEVYPQPARTASTTTLAGAMLPIDSIANLTNASGFLLPFGFFQVDQEIMGYNTISGNFLMNILRGLGGTVAASHSIGANVQELNIFWSGKRQLEPNYQPGQSASIVPLPSGWDLLLAQYVGGRAKNIEHDGQYWQQLESNIKQSLNDFDRPLKGVMRRRQVGPPTSPATFYNTPAGGLLIN
jgi:hypothetical protein